MLLKFKQAVVGLFAGLAVLLGGCSDPAQLAETAEGQANLQEKAVFTPEKVPTVYRFAKVSNGAYFYTGSEEEVRIILGNYPDFRFEGPAFEKEASAASVPVFRFANLLNGGYFFTGSAEERDIVLRDYPHMRFEGSTFSVASDTSDGTVPVYRLANLVNGAYLYTLSAAERDYAVSLGMWRFEGSTFKTANPDAFSGLSVGSTNGLYLLPGGSISFDIVTNTFGGKQYSVIANTGSADFVSTVSDFEGKLQVTVSAPSNAGAGTLNLQLQVTEARSGKLQTISRPIAVLTPNRTDTGNVNAAGGAIAVGVNERVEFSANRLSAPVQAAVKTYTAPTGDKIYEVNLAPEARGQGIRIKFPKPAIYDPYNLVAATAGERVVKSAHPNDALPLTQTVQEKAQSLWASAKSLAGISTKAVAPTLQQSPYSTGGTIGDSGNFGLGKKLLRIDDCFINFSQSRIVGPSYGQACEVGVDNLPWVIGAALTIAVTPKPAAEIHASINQYPFDQDWSGYEPVLFVHGFSPLGLGGGKGTWDLFPKLVLNTPLPTGVNFVPFEFHWDTNAQFETVAGDLARSVDLIHRISNKKVHIVAHSFGGVLSRLMLQNAGVNTAIANDKVASLTTLGTPHSGILSSNSTTWAPGQDMLLLSSCHQVSCWQMGAGLPSLSGYASETGIAGKTPGYLVDTLNNSKAALPNINILAGIGLSIDPVVNRINSGDSLISFAGQRFEPFSSTIAATVRLLNNKTIGAAKVTEEILGLPSNTRPGTSLDVTQKEFATSRKLGYLHSSGTGLRRDPNTARFDATLAADDGTGYGLMAAPGAIDCASTSSCKHAGYLLFKQQMDLSVVPRLADLARNNPEPKPLSATTGNADKDIFVMQKLNELNNKGAIYGNRIWWQKLTEAELVTMNAQLSAVLGNNANVNAAILKRSDELMLISDFDQRYLSRANNFVVMNKTQAYEAFVRTSINVMEASVGVLQVFYPYSATVAEITYPISPKGDLRKLKFTLQQLKDNTALGNALLGCTSLIVPISEWRLALQRIIDGGTDTADWLKAVRVPSECLLSIAQRSGTDREQALAKFFEGSVDAFESTNKIGLVAAYIDMANAVIDMLPLKGSMRTQLLRVQGVLDTLSALNDSHQLGLEIAKQTSDVVHLRFDQINDLMSKTRAGVLKDYQIRILEARMAGLYESGETKVVPGATTIAVGQGTTLNATFAPLGATQVRWTVNGTQLPGSYPIGSPVSFNPTTAGTYAIVASFLRADGTIISTASSSITVGVSALATVQVNTLVDAVGANQGSYSTGANTDDTRPTFKGTLSKVLDAGHRVAVLLDGTVVGFASVSGTNWELRPTAVVTTGLHAVTAKVENGPVTGPLSNTFQFTIGTDSNSLGRLNDTGITQCSDYAFNTSQNHTLGLSCALTVDTQGDPIPPGQDALFGRDAKAAAGTLTKIGGGDAGFDFTKLDASGNALPASATVWSCVRDNNTKLVWENKTNDGSLRDWNKTYTWYSSDAATNGGVVGSNSTANNTQAYAAAVNATNLCGSNDWRLPDLQELKSIVHLGRFNPSIDVSYFQNTKNSLFWSSSVYAVNPNGAWVVYFGSGYGNDGNRSYSAYVRLVRSGQ